MRALQAVAPEPVRFIPEPGDGRPRVLLVDDDLRVCRALTALLRLNGWSVVIARNGRKALEVLAEDRGFDLILSDIDMPVLDGYGLATQVELCYPELRVVLMTGSSSPDSGRTDSRSLVQVIGKPSTAGQLRAMLPPGRTTAEWGRTGD